MNVVDSGEVASSRGCGCVFGMEAEGEAVYERVWYVRVVLVRLHCAEVHSWLYSEARLVVEEEFRSLYWVAVVDSAVVEPVVALGLAPPAYSEDELERRVVEVELDVELPVLCLLVEVLVLYDEYFEGQGCEALSLCVFQVYVREQFDQTT